MNPASSAAAPNLGNGAAHVSSNGARKGRGGPHQLTVVSPNEEKGRAFPLTDELTIGRSPRCNVPLASDGFVSQLHARLFRRGDEYWVEDLGSTNGTLMNGRADGRSRPTAKG